MTAETITVNVPISVEQPVPLATKKVVRDSTKWLHKTKLCVYSVQGSCRLGSKCSFAHAASEVQDAPNLHKTQLCEAYAEGKCSNEHCTFAHGEEELRLSPNFKNKLCKWFDKGKCRNGSDCSFAHGEEQLRSERCALQNEEIAPPPGLSLEDYEACVQERRVLDLDSSLLDAKAPHSLEQQVEGMSATIAALQVKMDDMVLRTQVGSMKQFLGQLSSQCAELEAVINQGAEAQDVVAKAPWKKTPLKTKLSSKASLFQPFALSNKANSFVPGYEAYQGYASFEGCESYWPSDDSTSMGSGGFSSD